MEEGKDRKMSGGKNDADELRRELVNHFRQERTPLRQEWVHQMTGKKLLEGLTPQETEAESATIYDTCIECIETAHYDSAEAYAKRMAERGVLRGMTSEQILGGMLTLRDVYGRSLFRKYREDMARLTAALDVYEPVASNILAIVAMAFIRERENVVRQQQEAIRELSTPVLQVREGLLILPIIGLIDSLRAKQLTEQLLRAIRDNRAKAVVVDITGVPAVDSKIANHLLQTVDAARLMGARVIVTGLSPEVAQALVTIGVDLTRLKTVGDLQGGIEEADKHIGYKVYAERDTMPSEKGPA
jgi:rsbT co-antagonist protein RsbR